MITQSRRKGLSESGAKYKSYRGKRLFEKGNKPFLPKMSDKVLIKTDKIRDGNSKLRVLQTNIANVYDSKSKKFSKTKITAVVDNPANKHYVRRNIITKGTVVVTELGKAVITNRPGQEGAVNAVLI